MTPPIGERQGVYVIECSVTGKCYVGSTVNARSRWNQHRRELRLGKHHSAHLQAAWDKHGPEAFQFRMVELVEDPAGLVPREQAWLDELQAHRSAKGYNSSPTAGNCLGVQHTPERVQQMREYPTGRLHSEEVKAKIGDAHRGLKRTPETRAKISAARAGKPLSEAQRAVVEAMHEGRKGTTHSEETKAKMREARKGRPAPSEATRAKMSESAKAKVVTEETRLKMGAAQRGRKHSPETLIKMRESALNRVR